MRNQSFDPVVFGDTDAALRLVGTLPESSTRYSIIGKDFEGKILLWNEGPRGISGYTAANAVGKANSSNRQIPEDVKQ